MKSISDGGTAGDGPAVLSIGEVSQRTGIPVAGLRNWEQRYGLPRPERLPNGRRRYRESDCLLLDEVLRGRAQGLSLAAAMAHALSGAGPFRDTSIFAGLRRRHPGLQVHVMTKTMLLALTHAIEDECCARAQRPVLVGAFQRQRFYRQARSRWTDLARTAAQTLVFADFGQRGPQSGPQARRSRRSRSPRAPRCTASGLWSATHPTIRPAWRAGSAPGRRPGRTLTGPSRWCGRSIPRWSAAPPASAPGWPPRRRSRSRPSSGPGWTPTPRPARLTCAGPAGSWSARSTTSAGG